MLPRCALKFTGAFRFIGTSAIMAEAAPYLKGNVIDGKAVAGDIRKQIAARVSQLKEKHGKV
jgi:hypothetical protein